MSLTPFVVLEVPLADAGAGDVLPLGDAARHHLRTVLRLRDGAEVEVADGRGRHGPARLHDTTVQLLAAPRVVPPPTRPLVLVQAVPKGRKLDEAVRQATELGVDVVLPVLAARGVRSGADASWAARLRDRAEQVARAACEQARRPRVPRVLAPVPVAHVASALDGVLDGGTLLVAHPGGDGLTESLHDTRGAVAVAVGPEGGWTDGEVATLVAAGARPVGLGPTVLRTEHAGAAALAALAMLLGRWDPDVVRPATCEVHGASSPPASGRRVHDGAGVVG